MERPNLIEHNRPITLADKLFENNTIWIEKRITRELVNECISALDIIEKRCMKNTGGANPEIRLLISGEGGNLLSCLNLISYLKNSKFNITTIAVNSCYSASALLWLSGNRRLIFPHSKIYLHECHHTAGENLKYDIKTVREILSDMTKLNDIIYEHIADAVGIDKKNIKRKISGGRELVLSAKEAYQQGYATGIISSL